MAIWRRIFAAACVIAGLLAGQSAWAQALGPETNLPLPRYVSLRAAEVNVRRGPGLDYRIDWVFMRAGLPVRIVDEYSNWRKIADSDNAGGWVYHALLTRHRTVLVTEPEVTLREGPSEDTAAPARAAQGVVAALRQCQPDWCEVQADGHRGWVRKAAVWGVDPDEVFGG